MLAGIDPTDSPSPPRRVLVVDDEEVMRRMMTRALGEARHWCASTGSGEEAVELLALQRFDLAVVDKNLPDLDGIEVARRALGLSPPVPVIIVTGFPSDESRREAKSIGVFGYLTKPFGMYRLQREVGSLLDSVGEHLPAPPSQERPSRPPLQMSEVVQGPARPAVRSTEPNIERPAGVERPAVIDVAILLVEPDARVRQTLLEILTRKGCRVVAFRSVHQAEIHVRHAGYDVLIASPEVLRETQHWPRRTPGGAPLGTIAVVGTGAVDRKVEAVQLGASGVLTPPFEAAAVVLEIRSAISRMRDR